MTSTLSYDVAGATSVADAVWADRPEGYRRFERTVRLGFGDELWVSASQGVLAWAVKTRSGFTVPRPADGEPRVRVGQDVTIVVELGPFRLREPARVIAVVENPDRCGFAYGTRPGHPVRGEEAFIVHRSADGSVWFTLRSLTRSAGGRWKVAFPAVLLAQRVYRRRYLRALVPSP